MHNGYTCHMAQKNVAFKIRVEAELRRAFVDACRREDRPASQVVREFMRNYVQKFDRERQLDLLDNSVGSSNF